MNLQAEINLDAQNAKKQNATETHHLVAAAAEKKFHGIQPEITGLCSF